MRRMIALTLVAVAAVLLPQPAPAAEKQPLVADLSKHLVAITTGFAGTEVLLFGAAEEDGDVVVVVRGPRQETTVRKKARRALIWANAGEVRFTDAPAYYWVGATKPLDKIAEPSVLERHQIGVDSLDFTLAGHDEASPELKKEYIQGMISLKQSQDLYSKGLEPVAFLGNQLFRSEVAFPANVPVGTYNAEVYLFKNGEVVSAEITPLVVSKVGVGADVYDFAHEHAAWYGIIAIIIAVTAGWLAGVAFKKA